MDENARAETDRIWHALKPGMESLAAAVSAWYAALGSHRQCRHINELWHPECAAVGIGFVPPEARERLEALVAKSGLQLHRGNGPLGKGVYFSFLHDAQLTRERLAALGDAIAEETRTLGDAPPSSPPPLSPPDPAMPFEQQVARVEGLTAARGGRLRTRPAEVAGFVDAFNAATAEMTPAKAIGFLADAVPYLDLPDISRRELLRTLEMMRDAEARG